MKRTNQKVLKLSMRRKFNKKYKFHKMQTVRAGRNLASVRGFPMRGDTKTLSDINDFYSNETVFWYSFTTSTNKEPL